MTLVLPANVYPALPGRDKSGFYEWDCIKGACDNGSQEVDSSAISVDCTQNLAQSCQLNKDNGCKRLTACCKRKSCVNDLSPPPPPKRISPYWNTPKQRKDDRRRALSVTTRKLRQISDPERCLHRAVLLNNTLQRIQRELSSDECATSHVGSRTNHSWARRARQWRESKTSQRQIAPSNLFDDHFAHWCDADDKMAGADDVSDALARNVKNLLGDGSCNGAKASSTESDDSISTPSTPLTTDRLDARDDTTRTGASSSSQHLSAVDMDTCPSFSNLTEDERLVLGEMDTVFSNFMKVIATAT